MKRRMALWAVVGLLTHGALALAATHDNVQSFRGVTQPYRKLQLKAGGKKTPPWSGRINRVQVDEGHPVQPGQVILEMDKRDEDIEFRTRKLIAENRGELQGAMVRERMLKEIWLTNKAMTEKNQSISQEDVNKKELEYRLATADRQRLELAQARAQLDMESAALSLENRLLRSPIKGYVEKIFMREGETCEANEPLALVVDTSRCVFLCNIAEKFGRAMRTGQPVDLTIQTGTAERLKHGTISFVSGLTEQASGLMTVKAEFENADGQIRPGVPGTMLVHLLEE